MQLSSRYRHWKELKDEIDNYGPLIRNLQVMYENYDFKFIPIVIGAIEYVPKTLNRYLQDRELTQKQSQHLTRILELFVSIWYS